MEKNLRCPFCGKGHEILDVEFGRLYKCGEGKNYLLHNSVFSGINYTEKERRLNVIYNFIRKKPFADEESRRYWKFYYDSNVTNKDDDVLINVYFLMKEYPVDVAQKLDSILLNLAEEYPLLSDTFAILELATKKFRLIYCESQDRKMETCSIFSYLSHLNYIEVAVKFNDDVNKTRYRITVDGWKKISELKQSNELSKQGFIAMSFDPSVKYIENCFKKAISEAGYKPQIIKDKEHNNYIMPEIFYEIKRSRFVVVDVTKPNFGAYYEAGYAHALGKEVIVCCKKETFENKDTKPHFDIAQKSMILWENESDLITRLKNRIKATVSN